MKNASKPEPAPGDSVLADLEAGEEPILLADLPGKPFMPRARGRKGQRRPLHIHVPYNWAKRGKGGIKLETLQTPSGAVTTRSAVLRFFGRLSGNTGTVTTPGQARRQHERSERELDAIGI